MSKKVSIVGHGYKEAITNKEKISFLIDGHKNFGWIVDENISHNIPDYVYKIVVKKERKKSIH